MRYTLSYALYIYTMHTSYGRGWWMDACWIVDRAQHTRMDNTCSGFFERSSPKSVDGRTAAAALLPLLVASHYAYA